jgi:putative component of toxin-antitoxin plasmid stabilization module
MQESWREKERLKRQLSEMEKRLLRVASGEEKGDIPMIKQELIKLRKKVEGL